MQSSVLERTHVIYWSCDRLFIKAALSYCLTYRTSRSIGIYLFAHLIAYPMNCLKREFLCTSKWSIVFHSLSTIYRFLGYLYIFYGYLVTYSFLLQAAYQRVYFLSQILVSFRTLL